MNQYYRQPVSKLLFFLFFITIPLTEVLSQNQVIPLLQTDVDKCGIYDPAVAAHQLKILGDHWGYGYDSLLVDLNRWAQSPYVTIDSLGASVENRALWQLTITSDQPSVDPRRTIFIHARTHPGEVQGWWVTNELINLLLSDDAYAQFVREKCVFYIIPMYNPDGVELEYPRENAHGIDIESNWDKDPVEPEVAVLRNRFSELMLSNAPIEAALNMHSALACKRYFVYHDAAGTSVDYTALEQDFIGGVRSYFLSGIQPWNYFVSWTSGTPTRYPESWFWLNFQEAVMALTYEDMNCSAAGSYDQTAFALLHGVADYLGLMPTGIAGTNAESDGNVTLRQSYPNPVKTTQSVAQSTVIQYQLQKPQHIRLTLYDILGRQVKLLDEGFRSSNIHQVIFDASQLATGIYFYSLETAQTAVVKQLTVMK